MMRTMMLCGVAATALMASGAALALESNNPVDEEWWPSEFGEDDQAGATNWITDEKRLEAAQLVQQGKVITLGMPYHNRVPLFPGRTFALSIPGGGMPTHDLPWAGENYRQTFMDELLTAEIGQAGTQFDALSHPMIRIEGVEGWEDGNYLYNGFRLEDIGGPRGLAALGPENVGSFFTRGIMLDIPAIKGVERLDKGYEITMEDFNEALEAHGIDDASQGDVVMIRTGWNLLWRDNLDVSQEEAMANNAEFNSGQPGVHPEVCDHLAEQRISMLGMDNWGIEPYDFEARPPAEIEAWGYCHMNLVTRRGIYLLENVDLLELANEGVHEFLFSWAPLKLVGATGSPANPLAIY